MNQKEHFTSSPLATSFINAKGKIPYNMTNDYMFRAVLQSNNKVLRGLICALLHLQESDIRSEEITNTIVLGQSIASKEIRLDVNVLLNDDRLINLEMQVANELNWPNRSVLYLCRSFDQLNHGQNYNEIKPVIHIGFLDYTLFEEYPEFYATYKLININNHHIYSDNMALSVVNLSKIDLASEEDRKYHIDKWAALFKAKTWEEIKMIAGNSEYLSEATKSIFQMCSDAQIRKMCLEIEEYHLDMQCFQRIIAEQEEALAMKDGTIAEQKEALAEKDEALAMKDDTLAKQEDIIRKLKAEVESLRNNY
ncbi:MAG: Rpn family recombination-promoting nuclease/putative transposase [Lachnospiraceae bacterium]|nr:Rpn family recombination-promoting nuclease/putative transposase [Lachnospiraceae bacterium]